MLSPVVEKVHGSYRIRFSFREDCELVSDEDPLSYTVMGVDLGINAPASWCIMTADGTVRKKGVIHLPCDEGRLNHYINRKKKYQRSGKKSRSIYRLVNNANRQLSINTTKEIMRIAELYDVDCIVFEHLDKNGKIKGGRYKERIHMWRAIDVQKRVELQAHRDGMHISRVCAWGTSKLAFNGSGEVKRGSQARLRSYSLCRFQNDKIYNCDLSAAQNIAARYFLRIYANLDEDLNLPATPQRTLATLKQLNERIAA